MLYTIIKYFLSQPDSELVNIDNYEFSANYDRGEDTPDLEDGFADSVLMLGALHNKLSLCKKLRRIILDYSDFGIMEQADYKPFLNILTSTLGSQLNELEIINSPLNGVIDHSWIDFCLFIQDCKQLQKLTLSNYYIETLNNQHWMILGAALSKLSHLQVFNIIADRSQNSRPSIVWAEFCGALKQLKSLQSLMISGCDLYRLTAKNWADFADAVSDLGCLSSVSFIAANLGRLRWGDEVGKNTVKALIKAIGTIQNLQSLNLQSNWISELNLQSQNWTALTVMLVGLAQFNKRLKCLDLSKNNLLMFEVAGLWTAFCNALARFGNIRELDLNQALPKCLTLVQFQELLSAISKIKSLESLDLRSNWNDKIDNHDWLQCIRSIVECKNLRYLYLRPGISLRGLIKLYGHPKLPLILNIPKLSKGPFDKTLIAQQRICEKFAVANQKILVRLYTSLVRDLIKAGFESLQGPLGLILQFLDLSTHDAKLFEEIFNTQIQIGRRKRHLIFSNDISSARSNKSQKMCIEPTAEPIDSIVDMLSNTRIAIAHAIQ